MSKYCILFLIQPTIATWHQQSKNNFACLSSKDEFKRCYKATQCFYILWSFWLNPWMCLNTRTNPKGLPSRGPQPPSSGPQVRGSIGTVPHKNELFPFDLSPESEQSFIFAKCLYFDKWPGSLRYHSVTWVLKLNPACKSLKSFFEKGATLAFSSSATRSQWIRDSFVIKRVEFSLSVKEEDQLLEIANDGGLKVCSTQQLYCCSEFNWW